MEVRKYTELDMAANGKRVEQELDPKESAQKYDHNPKKRYHVLHTYYLKAFARLQFEIFEKKNWLLYFPQSTLMVLQQFVDQKLKHHHQKHQY